MTLSLKNIIHLLSLFHLSFWYVAINVLKNAYCKKKIEIIAFYNNEETSRLFKIVINENGSMMMPLGYVEETLLPGTLSEEIEIKIAELKSKN